MDQGLSFIHLSDIHFTRFSGDNYDLDDDLRTEILKDVANAKNEIGIPTGILICGDIAFSGNQKEYEAASDFLLNMCKRLEIPQTAVLCVPGNHDVDQSVSLNSEGLVDMQNAISNATNYDNKLAAYFRDSVYGPTLFRHIHEYNKFAAKFSCQIDAGRPNWNFEFPLTDDFTLSVLGLNSVITSNHHDKKETKMVLGEYQIPKGKQNVTYLSLCHHPEDCWIDSEQTKNKLNGRIAIQLYGHKHISKIKKVDDSLVIGSGATHPCRKEQVWRPRYNWLSLSILDSSGDRKLNVKVYPRVLDEDNIRFIADTNQCHPNIFKGYQLKLSTLAVAKSNKNQENKIAHDITRVANETKSSSVLQNPRRTLIYRFLELAFIARSKILSKFNLLAEEDDGKEHIEIVDKILDKAEECGCLSKLWESVNSAHSDGAYNENPFENLSLEAYHE